MTLRELSSISPIDGRYYERLRDLSMYFSEYGLMHKRVFLEIKFLKALGKGDYSEVYKKFDLREAGAVKEIEDRVNHDVKAVEYYIREKVPEDVKEFVHYGLTSEDINNLAYSLILKEFIHELFSKRIDHVLLRLKEISLEHKKTVMLARTHGQAASPTTLGKEFFVFYSRLESEFSKLKKIRLSGKLNGATGNFNALHFAEPEVDWIMFSKNFVLELGLVPNIVTTQVEPKDTLVELFQAVKRINNIILDLDRDVWLYISMDYFRVKKKDDEVGSSTMPHKVNPIDFENSEGNLKVANSLFTGFEELQISRLQRDLSDSTVMRNIGVAFAHSLLAYDSTLKGLGKVSVNFDKIEKDLESHPEVLAEAVQTVLRKYGKGNAYEKLKEISRGKEITLSELHEFIDTLDIDSETKDRLKKLQVKDYVGVAERLSELVS